MRVLVTGATGYIGYAVLPALLEAGHEAVAMVRNHWADAPAGVEIRYADLADPAAVSAAVRGCDGVIHLAALGHGAIGSAVARICNVAGAVGDHGDLADTRILPRAIAVASGRIDRVDVNGDGSAVRDFVHVRDVATALVTMLVQCTVGEQATYNVGATAASVLDVVGTVERITGRQVAVNHRPASRLAR